MRLQLSMASVLRPHKQVASANQDMKRVKELGPVWACWNCEEHPTGIAFLLRKVESVVENRTAPVGLHVVSLIQASLQALLTYAYRTTHYPQMHKTLISTMRRSNVWDEKLAGVCCTLSISVGEICYVDGYK
jgi:hypothetical protein